MTDYKVTWVKNLDADKTLCNEKYLNMVVKKALAKEPDLLVVVKE